MTAQSLSSMSPRTRPRFTPADRDVFLFLVDDTHPIEAGRLPDGSPDLYFRGFYCWNSEVGSKTLGIASFYLRAVCMNRNLWGVENFEEITIRHSKFAAQRFAHEAAPALTRFADSSSAPFIAGIKAARERIVARSGEDRTASCASAGFPNRRPPKSSRRSCTRKAARRRACLILFRGYQRWRAQSRIRTRVWRLRVKQSGCWKAPPECQAAQPKAGARPFRKLNNFPPIRHPDRRRTRIGVRGSPGLWPGSREARNSQLSSLESLVSMSRDYTRLSDQLL